MSTAIKATVSPTAPAAKNAITQLKADHAKVSGLFAEYEKARSTAKKKALVADIACLARRDDVVQRFKCFFDRNVIVPAMDLVEVDIVCAGVFEAGVDPGHDRLA